MPLLSQSGDNLRDPENFGRRPSGRKATNPSYRLIVLLGAALALTTLWAGGASYYLLFHDEMLARFVSQQSAMRFTYEERLGALQLQLDRAATDRVVGRNGIETRLAALAERQALIEKRHGLLSGLAGVPAEPVAQAPESYAPIEMPVRDRKPFPTPGIGLRKPGEGRDDAPDRLTRAEQRLERLAETQLRALGEVGFRAGRNAERYRDLIVQTGIDPDRFARTLPIGQGGPLVPIGSDEFSQMLASAKRRVDEELQLRRIAGALPLRRPLRQEAVQTSSFGTRLDPFTRGIAMHTGVDFRAETGVPAVATAAGRISAAEANGGYGHMVEIDHGHGVVTRYAHLSGYAVSPGQRIEAGQVVGYVGSTGRSTGSHLHYETRVDGEAVDPGRFLRAGAQLVFAD